MRTQNRFFRGVVVEGLEDRRMLTAVVTIVGSNTPTELLQVHFNAHGEIKVNRNNVWSTLHVGYDTIVKVQSGTYIAPKTSQSGVPSKGKHIVQIFSNANIVKEIDVRGTQDSLNYIDVNAFCTSKIKVIGGWRCQNYETSKITNKLADVVLIGGLQSSNYLTSLNGYTTMVGGDYSANYLTNKVGYDILQGGAFSSNYLTVYKGRNTLIGGNNSANIFNIYGGNGYLKSGGYSSNTVYTVLGKAPTGFTIDTRNGAFVYRKFN